jgi:hypothetical protein
VPTADFERQVSQWDTASCFGPTRFTRIASMNKRTPFVIMILAAAPLVERTPHVEPMERHQPGTVWATTASGTATGTATWTK